MGIKAENEEQLVLVAVLAVEGTLLNPIKAPVQLK